MHIGGLGATEQASGQNWMTAIENVIKTVTGGAVAVSQAKTAIQIQNANIARVKQGLPPIDQYTAQQMYVPPVYQGAAYQTVSTLGSSRNMLLIGGAVALVGLLFFMRRK